MKALFSFKWPLGLRGDSKTVSDLWHASHTRGIGRMCPAYAACASHMPYVRHMRGTCSICLHKSHVRGIYSMRYMPYMPRMRRMLFMPHVLGMCEAYAAYATHVEHKEHALCLKLELSIFLTVKNLISISKKSHIYQSKFCLGKVFQKYKYRLTSTKTKWPTVYTNFNYHNWKKLS